MIKLPIFLNDQEMNIWTFSTSWVWLPPLPRFQWQPGFLHVFFLGFRTENPSFATIASWKGQPPSPRETWQMSTRTSQVHAEFLGASVATACAIHAKASLQTFHPDFGVCLMGKNWHKICTRKIPNKISEKCIASKFASWKFAFLWKYVTPFSTNRLVVATQIALTLHPFCLGGNHPRWLAHLFQTGWLKPPSLGFINSVPAISKLEGWRTSGFGRNQGVFGAMVTV